MTTIVELEFCIRSTQTVIKRAEATLERLNAELTELKAQAQEQPEPASLLGRWATHPNYGRGIIASDKPDTFKEVRFTIRNDEFTDGADQSFIRVDDLTLDPATLTTQQDFDKAPVGTIVEDSKIPQDVYMKSGAVWYVTGDTYGTLSEGMPPCRVIRWGNGQ